MQTLAIDIETYSGVDLGKSGAYRYCDSPDFTLLLFGCCADGGEIRVVDIANGEALPAEICAALTDPDVIKTAYNANFERTCLAAYLGVSMPAEQWSCTMALARSLGLPASLAECGAALGLPADQQKDRQGKALIRFFCNPCAPTKANGGRRRNLPCHDPEKWQLFVEYNRRDVVAEQAIRTRLLKVSPLPDAEERLWRLDQEINDYGVAVDTRLADSACECNTRHQTALLERARALTGLANPKSVQQIKDWIEGLEDVEVESLSKKLLPDIKAQAKTSAVRDYLDMREDLSKTSVKKYEALSRCTCSDGRVRGLLQFYGASTGRWAGRLVQVQNLPQNHLSDIDVARDMLKRGEFDALELLYSSVPRVLSELIRTAFIPSEGCRFIVSDFSAIEARVIAWLAGEDWRTEVFNNGGDIYCASASKMFGVPVVKHGVNGHLRQKGKIAELALGYGGSVGALKAMGALDMGLTENELPGLVSAWRTANTNITDFWWRVDRAARSAVTTVGISFTVGRIAFVKQNEFLFITLPSGRRLSYIRPRLERSGPHETLVYTGVQQTSGKLSVIETYGPKLVENIVQATSRDILAESLLRLAKKGYRIAFHVHDEVILDVPKGKSSAAEVSEIMGRPITWAEGLPLRADGYECDYYMKD